MLVCLALFLEGMSSSSINVQVGAIRADLAPTDAQLQLVVSGFLITYAGLLPLAGQLADRWSRRRVFLLGLVLFGLGSVVCAAAAGPGWVVAGRFAQGAGAALSAPAALALVTHGLPEGLRRNRAVAMYGAMGAAGFSTGLVVPGLLVSWVGWRASFLVVLPLVLLVLAATWGIPDAATSGRGRIDVAGSLALTAVVAVVVHALGSVGDTSGGALVGLLTVGAALVGFLVRRGGVTGLPLEVFTTRRVLAAAIALGTVFAAVLSSMYVLSLALQEREGLDAHVVGLLILPQPLTFFAASSWGARSTARFGPGRTLAGGMVLIAASLAVVGLLGEARWPAVLGAMAGVGAGMALVFPAASITAVDAVHENLRATTASVLTTAQNLGGALGLALLTAAALVPAAGGGVTARPGAWAAVAMLLVGGAAAALTARISRTSRTGARRGARRGLASEQRS